MDSKTQNKKIFYRALAGISLYVPCEKEETGNVDLRTLTDEHGACFVPAFFSKRSLKGDFEGIALIELAFPQLRRIIGSLPQNICGVMIEPYDKEICLDRNRMAEYDRFLEKSFEISF